MLDLALGVDRFLTDQRPQLVLQGQQFAAGIDRAALAPRHRNGHHLADPPRTPRQDDNAIGEPDRFLQIMRHVNRAHRAVGEQANKILHQQFAGLRVQRRERLVHQEDRGLHRKRPRNADALAHAAG